MGAKEGKEIHFSLVDSKNLSPVKYKKVSAKTGKELTSGQISKAYKMSNGKYVLMTEKDFEAANPRASKTIEMENFVALEEINPMFFESSYYIVPQKGGEKGYVLLRDALAESGKVAIAKLVLRGKQHLCCTLVRENYLILLLMRFSHQVLETHEASYISKASEKAVKYSATEKKMAEQLISSMTVKWKPENYKDTFYNDMMKRIKLKSKKTFQMNKEEEESQSSEIETSAKILDLTELLKRSLEPGHGKAKRSSTKKSSSKVKRATKSKKKVSGKNNVHDLRRA